MAGQDVMSEMYLPPRGQVPKQERTAPEQLAWSAIVVMLILGVVSAVVRGHAPTGPVTAKVPIVHVSFAKPSVSVTVGSTVQWQNMEEDGTLHGIVGDPLNSPDLSPGMSWSYTFGQPGVYVYHCRFHPYMHGTVTVNYAGAHTGHLLTRTAPAAPADPFSPGPSLGDGTHLLPYVLDHGVKVFHLRMAPLKWAVKPGEVHDAYAFNGVIPGPTIRVNQGDMVRIIVQDDLPDMTGVHWHGMELPNDEDGVPYITQDPIQPGSTYTYQWRAIATGSHWYHSHMGGSQVGKGLYGSLQVNSPKSIIKAAHDYTILIGDQDLGYVFNGKSFPATTVLTGKVGQRIHIRLTGAGDDLHPIHIHGGHFTLVAQDGMPLAVPENMDTLTVAPGQTFDIVFVPVAPGKWLLHCHRFSHSETESGMTGLVTYLDIAP